MTDTLIQKLEQLRAHLYGLDSGSGEAELLHQAITELKRSEISGNDPKGIHDAIASVIDPEYRDFMTTENVVRAIKPFLKRESSSEIRLNESELKEKIAKYWCNDHCGICVSESECKNALRDFGRNAEETLNIIRPYLKREMGEEK